MSHGDDLVLGTWNVRCDRCGKKLKAFEARVTWEGYWVCAEHWEPRHPQDFVRALPENPTPAFVCNPPDVELDTPDGIVLEDDATSLFFDPGADIEYILGEDGDWLITEH